MCSLGEPCDLRRDVLPTKRDIYKYYLQLNKDKVRDGEWKQNTKMSDKAGYLSDIIASIWDKTGIPHKLRGREGVRRTMALIMQIKDMDRLPMDRRKEGFGIELDSLFDVSIRQHELNQLCTCDEVDRVPLTWRAFLADQRCDRQLQGVLNDRTLSLRAAGNREKEDQMARETIRYKIEELTRKQKQEEERLEKSNEEINRIFEKVPLTDQYIEELENEGVDDNVEVEKNTDDNENDFEDNESDWEDIDDTPKEDTSKYNTMSLRYFSLECDRYGITDRAAAKVGNALLKDLGKVKRGDTSLLICPSKVRRERCKWGDKLAKENLETELPAGLYTDGKRVPTLNRTTTVTKVRVPGRRGKAAWRSVTTTSNTTVIEDHYPVLAQPGAQYVDHVTPQDGTGQALARELVALINERECKPRVIGMDGCAVNTG